MGESERNMTSGHFHPRVERKTALPPEGPVTNDNGTGFSPLFHPERERERMPSISGSGCASDTVPAGPEIRYPHIELLKNPSIVAEVTYGDQYVPSHPHLHIPYVRRHTHGNTYICSGIKKFPYLAPLTHRKGKQWVCFEMG